MPAKSRAQYRKARAECAKGKKWGCEMARKTRSVKKLPARKRKAKKK